MWMMPLLLTRTSLVDSAARYERHQSSAQPSRLACKAMMQASRAGDLVTCTIVEAELRYGAAKSSDPAANNLALDTFLAGIPVLPFDSDAAREYGRIRLILEKTGLLIGGNDLMISSIAIANGLIVVTHNVSEFSRVPDS